MGRTPGKANLSGHRKPVFRVHENTFSIKTQLSLVPSQLSTLDRNTAQSGTEEKGVQAPGWQTGPWERHTSFICCSKQSEVIGIYCTENSRL